MVSATIKQTWCLFKDVLIVKFGFGEIATHCLIIKYKSARLEWKVFKLSAVLNGFAQLINSADPGVIAEEVKHQYYKLLHDV